MRIGSWMILIGLAVPALAAAQVPHYDVELLGTWKPYRLSDTGQIIGNDTVSGAQRGFVVPLGQARVLLPLPAGMASSIALDINELGTVVGAVSASSSPEFGARAVAWDPNGSGGYTPRLLGALPGQAIGQATAVNNLGDIVGYSSDGTYRYAVVFTAPGGVLNLNGLGIFDPSDINDQRVLVDHSATTKRLDLDTMVVENLGVPPGGFMFTTAVAVNDEGQVGGLGILSCCAPSDRVAARYTDGIGWELFSTNGVNNGVSDMNEAGDVVMVIGTACYVRFDGLGTFLIEDLINNTVGHWFVSRLSGLTINSAGWIAGFGINQDTGQSGTILLRPASSAAVESGAEASKLRGLQVGPNPFRVATQIRFETREPTRARLEMIDVRGRVVRTLLDGTAVGSGARQVAWDGRDAEGNAAPAGVYFVRLSDGWEQRSTRVVFLP